MKKSKGPARAKPKPTSIVLPPDLQADIERIAAAEQRLRHPMMILLLRKGVESWGAS